VEQHQAVIKQYSKKPYDQSDAKKQRGGCNDKGDKKNGNDSIQHF
jgi:hypothetical protein